MSINLSVPTNETPDLKPRITVFGVGGAGGNAVNNMIASELQGVDFVVANTDAQALTQSSAERRIQLGHELTKGLGAGARSEIGEAAAEESIEEILEQIDGSNMAFIAAGMGGGTGTGAAPVIARAAKERGILTVAVVTKPFQFEGSHRMRIAEAGIKELEQYVDTLIIIPNQNLFRVANEKTTFADAFKMADDVLYSGVRGVTDLMVMPGLINLDFADVRSVMSEMGKAMMGTGEADGERRALDAAEAAISNPLLDDTSMKGANGVLINITGGPDMTLFEVDEAANRIRAEVDQDAYIIFGSTFDEDLSGKMRVSVVATGIDSEAAVQTTPQSAPTLSAAAQKRTAKPLFAAVLEADAQQPDRAEDEAPAEEAATDEVEEEIAETAEAEAETPEVADAEAPVTVDEVMPDAELEADPALPAVARLVTDSRETATEERPAAMPALGATDAFIPKKAAEVEPEETATSADPFAEADLLNVPKDVTPPPKKPTVKERGLSLFERVTGAARGSKTTNLLETKEESGPTPIKAVPPTSTEAKGPALGGVGTADRAAPPSADEDLLDIPAFLRRQAN